MRIIKFKQSIFILFFAGSINACQEDQEKMTPEEMLFQGAREKDEQKSLELVEEALKEGVDSKVKDCNGVTPIFWAVLNGNKKVVELLLNAGVNPDIQINEDTILMQATCNGNVELVRIILDAGADLNIKDIQGSTVLDMARGNVGAILDAKRRQEFYQIKHMIEDESRRRQELKDAVQKEIIESEALIPPLAQMVSEYVV